MVLVLLRRLFIAHFVAGNFGLGDQLLAEMGVGEKGEDGLCHGSVPRQLLERSV